MAIPEEIQEQVLAEATSATPTFSIDMNDQQFKDVDAAMKDQENGLENTYAGLIGGADQYYKDLANQSQQWADKQAQIQQDNTDFAIEKIEQQKEQAHKDYLKEQSGAYVDWQKQSNQYGVNAEKMASAGLTNTGYSESSQVSMYNAYQNRVATAREVMAQAKLAYDNNIKEAMLQNNAAIAEIYANTYKEQLELALQSYLNNQELTIDLANKKMELDNIKWNRYQDVYNRLFGEAQMAEDIRQYNETMKWNTEQKDLDRQHQEKLLQLEQEFTAKENQLDRDFKEEQAVLDRQLEKDLLAAKNAHEKEMAKINHDNAVAKLQAEYIYNKALLQQEHDLKNKSAGSVGTVSGSSGSNKTNRDVINEIKQAAGFGFTGTTYEQAAAYLKSKGISAAGLYDLGQWSSRSASYSITGQGSAAVRNNKTYQDYLKEYVDYKVNEANGTLK